MSNLSNQRFPWRSPQTSISTLKANLQFVPTILQKTREFFAHGNLLKLRENVNGAFERIGLVTIKAIRFVKDFVFERMVLQSYKAWMNAMQMMCLTEDQCEIPILPIEEEEKSVEQSNLEDVKIEEPNSIINDATETQKVEIVKLQNCEEEEKSVDVSNLEAKIEEPNSIIDDATETQKVEIVKLQNCEGSNMADIEVQKVVIDRKRRTFVVQNVGIDVQNYATETQKAKIVKLQNCKGSNKAEIDEQKATIEAQKEVIGRQNYTIEVQNALLLKLTMNEGLNKAKIEAQEKEHALMINLLADYQEALKRTQMEFQEFRERCHCEKPNEPIYRDLISSLER